jgi:hypothetical protein
LAPRKTSKTYLTQLDQRWADILAKLRDAEQADNDHSTTTQQHDADNATALLKGKPIDTTHVVLEARQTIAACKIALEQLFREVVALIKREDDPWKLQMPQQWPDSVVKHITERYERHLAARQKIDDDVQHRNELKRLIKKIESAKFSWTAREGRPPETFHPRDHLTPEECEFFDSAKASEINFRSAGGSPSRRAPTLEQKEERDRIQRDAAEAERVRKADLGVTA